MSQRIALFFGAISMVLVPVITKAAPLNHYSDYGVTEQSASIQNTTVSINSDPFGYSDAYTDNESGLQYLQVRYYDPIMMRFTQMDTYPLLNRYAYADENPIMNDDPSGHNAIGTNPTSSSSKKREIGIGIGIGIGLAGFILPVIGGFVASGEEGLGLIVGDLLDQADESEEGIEQEKVLKEGPKKDVKMNVNVLKNGNDALDSINDPKKFYRQVKIPLRIYGWNSTPGGWLDQAVTFLRGDDYSLSHSIFLRVNEEGTEIIINPFDMQGQNLGFLSSDAPMQLRWGTNTIGNQIITFNENVLKGAVSGPGRVLDQAEFEQMTQYANRTSDSIQYDILGRNGGLNCHMFARTVVESLNK